MTLFACPKPFVDPHIALIQRNAITSWMNLDPRPDIVLCGDETGIASICSELGIRHLPDVPRNEFGTPLLNGVFDEVERTSSGRVLAYVNSDILLMGDFLDAVSLAAETESRFMLGGSPWNLDVTHPLEFSDHWQEKMRSNVRSNGELRGPHACDFFVYTRGLWKALPPFVLGRCYFDNALLYLARKNGAALINATGGIMAVHQNHPYTGASAGNGYLQNPEALRNVELAGGKNNLYSWENATHLIEQGRLVHSLSGRLSIWGLYDRRLHLWRKHVWYPFLAITRPVRHLVGLRSSVFK